MLSLTAQVIHLGKDGGAHSAITCQFGDAGGLIGRSDSCDMTLPDAGQRISREQARIGYADGRYVISNVSVANPMYVNGVELLPGSSQPLSHGDELRMGTYVIAVAQSTEPISVSTPASAPGPAHVGQRPTQQATDRSMRQPHADSLVDPLAALGGGGRAGAESADPFADLLSTAVPVGKDNIGPEQTTSEGERAIPPPATATTAGEAGPLQQSTALDELTGAVSTQAQPPTQAMATSDPKEPRSSPQAHRATGSGLSDSDDVDERMRKLEAQLMQSQEPDSASQPAANWAPALSKLAGDPFVDLMGAPVESHIARAPAAPDTPRRMDYIPADFNPFKLGGVAQRNTSDPLAQLAPSSGLADVMPDRTIDSTYAPGTESPSALVVDPLDEARGRALQVEQSTDPLELFKGNQQLLDAALPENVQAGNAKSTSDHALEMTSFFRAPIARPDPAMSQNQTGSAGGMDAASPPVAQPPAGTESPHLPHHPVPEVGSPASVANLEPADMQPDPIDAAHSVAPVRDVSSAEADPPAPVASPPVGMANDGLKNDGVGGENAEALMAAFKRGAGLQEWQEPAITPEWMEIMGQMLQSAVQGTVALLAARAIVKQEIHLSVTLINPKANNPLKFLPDGHTALMQMLGPRIPGFMPPVDAMQEAFEDLVTHQTAIAAGTQAALEALFRRFAPSTIESQNPRDGIGEKVSGALYHARLWNAYRNQYEAIRNEVRDDFFKKLGADFHEAYDREYSKNAPGKQ